MGGQVTFTTGTTAGSTTTSSGGTACVIADMNVDMDKDGWTPAQGDCNDCDPHNVNPGAVDVPGDPNMVDSNCDGKYDPPAACDGSLALGDVNASDGAKAIELCQFTTLAPPTPKEKIWGVISSSYVRANGDPFTSPGLQVGIENGWGPNVHAQGGTQLLVLVLPGHARTSSDPGACGSQSCQENANGTPPPGFPQDNPNCPPSPDINDDVGLQLNLRTPTNATGYAFKPFKFYSMEFPYWVCNNYNDQFIALVNPAPVGAINGNISFDSMHNPVSVNLGFFDVCDPSQSSQYAAGCFSGLPRRPPTRTARAARPSSRARASTSGTQSSAAPAPRAGSSPRPPSRAARTSPSASPSGTPAISCSTRPCCSTTSSGSPPRAPSSSRPCPSPTLSDDGGLRGPPNPPILPLPPLPPSSEIRRGWRERARQARRGDSCRSKRQRRTRYAGGTEAHAGSGEASAVEPPVEAVPTGTFFAPQMMSGMPMAIARPPETPRAMSGPELERRSSLGAEAGGVGEVATKRVLKSRMPPRRRPRCAGHGAGATRRSIGGSRGYAAGGA